MKLNTTQIKELLRQLKLHKSNAKFKSINIINNNILLEKIADKLFITSTNLKNTLETSVRIQDTDDEFKAVVNISFLESALKLIFENIVEIKLTNDKLIIGNSIIDYCSPDLFPIIPEIQYNYSLSLSESEVDDLFEAVEFVGSDASNSVYSNVQLRYSKPMKEIMIMSTNSKIAYCNNVHSDLLFGKFEEILLDSNAIRLLKKNYNKKGERLQIHINGNKLFLIYNGMFLYTTAQEGMYPKAEVVFKKIYENKFTVKYAEFKSFIDSFYKVDNSLLIKATASKENFLNLQIKSENQESNLSIDCKTEGDELTFGMRADVIKRCLIIKQDNLSISYGKYIEPFIINLTDKKKLAFMPVRFE